MTTLTIEKDQLHIEVQGLDKLWALKSRLSLPLAHVLKVEPADALAKRWYHGFKVGTSLPGVITAGTFYKDGKRFFWDVHNPEKAISIYLDHEQYNQLVIEVEDPQLEIGRLTRAVELEMQKKPSAELIAQINQAQKEIKTGQLSPHFHTAEEATVWLRDSRK